MLAAGIDLYVTGPPSRFALLPQSWTHYGKILLFSQSCHEDYPDKSFPGLLVALDLKQGWTNTVIQLNCAVFGPKRRSLFDVHELYSKKNLCRTVGSMVKL